MTSRIGTWLAGGRAAAASAVGVDDEAGSAEQQERAYPGERLGLPATGYGSAAGLGRRLVALLVDCVAASLITSLFVHPDFMRTETMQTLNYWSVLTWFLITVISTAFFGFTPGMGALGIRVARLDGADMVLPLRAIVRAVLVAVIVPAVIWDADRCGLHDKMTGTIVIAMR